MPRPPSTPPSSPSSSGRRKARSYASWLTATAMDRVMTHASSGLQPQAFVAPSPPSAPPATRSPRPRASREEEPRPPLHQVPHRRAPPGLPLPLPLLPPTHPHAPPTPLL